MELKACSIVMDVLNIKLGKPIPSWSLPPEDPLNELTERELNLRKFCYEHNHEVLIGVGSDKYKVYLEPDICSLLEDKFTQGIKDLDKGKSLRIEFMESCDLCLELVPCESLILCYVNKSEGKVLSLDKHLVIKSLQVFVCSVYKLAHECGFRL